ncbi:RNA hairpin binding protein [Schizosaccharomyces cryophilus OY26]|uniref:RNA-binding protein VTS1 n=1 Tax=Schizosaccharomyces cryophilus (strain OY26 / ATCC MYA-4695 / CBS 11777 / NBRC 106824 / NRRL Y48691) TaxID=653667 RepID=S9W5X3_SCHCR|nr:RNA hairpin binding protein [Schizosaccharomyces cryophilus OY26]EPY53964.1 RNA hairpin binding protein [Schizosaccharomyces cryophilus OY26]
MEVFKRGREAGRVLDGPSQTKLSDVNSSICSEDMVDSSLFSSANALDVCDLSDSSPTIQSPRTSTPVKLLDESIYGKQRLPDEVVIDDAHIATENYKKDLHQEHSPAEGQQNFSSELHSINQWFQSLSMSDRELVLKKLLQSYPVKDAAKLFSHSFSSSPSHTSLSNNKPVGSSSSSPSSVDAEAPPLSDSLASLTPTSKTPIKQPSASSNHTQNSSFSNKQHPLSAALSSASPLAARTSSTSSSYFAQDRDLLTKNRLSKAIAYSSINPSASPISTSPKNNHSTIANNGTPKAGSLTNKAFQKQTNSELFSGASKKASFAPSGTPSKPSSSFFETPTANIWDSHDRSAFSAPPAPFFPLGISPHLNEDLSPRGRWQNYTYSPPPPPPPPDLLTGNTNQRSIPEKSHLLYRSSQIGPRSRLETRPSGTEGKPLFSSSLRFSHVPGAPEASSRSSTRLENPNAQPSTPLNKQTYVNDLPHTITPVPFTSLSYNPGVESERPYRRNGFWLNNWNSPAFLHSPLLQDVNTPYPQLTPTANSTYSANMDNSNFSTPVGMHMCPMPYAYSSYNDPETGDAMSGTSQSFTNYVKTPKVSIKTRKSFSNSKSTEKLSTNELPQDIPSWLRSLRLHKYTNNLKDTDWKGLVSLTDEDLQSRGINALGARRKLLKSFQEVAPLVEPKPALENSDTEKRVDDQKNDVSSSVNQDEDDSRFSDHDSRSSEGANDI